MSAHHRAVDWLENVWEAARQACDFVEGMTFDEFLADKRTQQAVAMSLLILGEAVAKLIEKHPEVLARHSEIPWASMKGMRNRIAHGYFELDLGVVWETVARALPTLVARLPPIVKFERDRVSHEPG